MIRIFAVMLTATTLICLACFCELAHAEGLTAQEQLALDIDKELVEINTVTETGDTARGRGDGRTTSQQRASPNRMSKCSCRQHARAIWARGCGGPGAQADPAACTSRCG